MNIAISENHIDIGGFQYSISRPHVFGLVIEGPIERTNEDYLHAELLAPVNRELFFSVIDSEGLVVCRNVTPVPRAIGKSEGNRATENSARLSITTTTGAVARPNPELLKYGYLIKTSHAMLQPQSRRFPMWSDQCCWPYPVD